MRIFEQKYKLKLFLSIAVFFKSMLADKSRVEGSCGWTFHWSHHQILSHRYSGNARWRFGVLPVEVRGSLDAQIKDRALSTSRPSLFTEHFYESFAFFLGLAQSMTFRIFCEGGGRKLSLITVWFFFFMIISTWTHRKVGQYHFKVHTFRLLVDTSFQIINYSLLLNSCAARYLGQLGWWPWYGAPTAGRLLFPSADEVQSCHHLKHIEHHNLRIRQRSRN